MGFFSSLGKLQKQAKEMERSQPPMEQRMAGALAQMQQANAYMAEQTAAAQAAADPAAVFARAQVIVVRDTGMKVNFDPTLEIDLLVTVPGQPPYPVTTRATVSQAHLARIAPGAMVAVRGNPATPQLVQFAWYAPVP